MEERAEKGQVLARCIIEMVGAPKEHIEDTLHAYLNKLRADKDLTLVKQEVTPAEKTEDEKFFLAFAEVEIWFKDMQKLTEFCFNAMPSHIEVLEPSLFKLQGSELSSIFTGITQRMHDADMTVKQLRARNNILEKNSFAVIRNMVLVALKDGDKTAAQLSKFIGIDEKSTEPFIKQLLEHKFISEEKGKYHLL